MDWVGDDPKGPGFPIRKSADQRALAPPRGLSQRATSFIASQCQGIHQMPLLRLIRSRSQKPEIGRQKSDEPLPADRRLRLPFGVTLSTSSLPAVRTPKPPPPQGARPKTRAAQTRRRPTP